MDRPKGLERVWFVEAHQGDRERWCVESLHELKRGAQDRIVELRYWEKIHCYGWKYRIVKYVPERK